MSPDSRERMVRSAAALIAARGVSATSLSDVVAESQAPRGSIYHHFPRGKEQLAEDAVRWTSALVLAHIDSATGSPGDVLRHFTGLWRRVVLASNGASGCAVAGVAIDSGAEAGLLGVAGEVFQGWSKALARQLERAGLGAGRARSIALATLAGMEGALILCRTERSVAPLDTVAAELLRLLPPEAR